MQQVRGQVSTYTIISIAISNNYYFKIRHSSFIIVFLTIQNSDSSKNRLGVNRHKN